MIEHLNRIGNLGFVINLTWNQNIDILYQVSDQWSTDVRVLYCSYNPSTILSYEDLVEATCDFFYAWYNKNLDVLKDYEVNSTESNFEKLVESGLGDITQQVYRDFNIENLLNK